MRTWLGLVLTGLGALGILGAVGALDPGRAIDRWWPVAVIAWAALAMIADRTVSRGNAALVLVGGALLVGAQGWVADDVLWPIVVSVVGIAILLGGVDVTTGCARRTRRRV